ncbi:MAG TPA: sigma-70 family RNA polymerase sigma factor [Acidimicrobiales bacterium]|nr:sigma-70 family RNA polymerase sigma factor [Acidimicrobiales bacterium]
MDDIGGSTEAVTRLVREEYVRLVRAVALVCGSTAAAEDAVQEALARAWDRLQRGHELERPASWVVTVALNLTRSGLRRQALHRRTLPRLAAPGEHHDDPPELLDLRAAVAALPRRQREAVVMHYYLGFDVASIGSVLGVSDGTVKSALFRARAALAAALGEPEVTHHD